MSLISEIPEATTTVEACSHQPRCPDANDPDREAACIRIAHPEQGWSLLCNGVISFDDTGELLPDGRAVAPHRVDPHSVNGATPS